MKSKRLVSRLSQSPLTYIILVLFLGLFIYSAIGIYKKSRLATEKVEVEKEELANLYDQKNKLSTDLDSANTEFGTEKAIREKFNMVKDGEKVIMIVQEPNTQNDENSKDNKGFWQFLKRIFTKN